eukprot:CAMPEP_0172598596 /NCGR_PEP_ID=MMETSP1068-20121228/18643_1 /TAXON_ID=35684 /ORGANISM="Pseudopedinella elastica, Strain CCMP716" /LENGTH=64 /DNA_ID=CAMNT_0013398523 /DNA_START=254 /DNA_END=444 /DNA_ORIENTATION=-
MASRSVSVSPEAPTKARMGKYDFPSANSKCKVSPRLKSQIQVPSKRKPRKKGAHRDTKGPIGPL